MFDHQNQAICWFDTEIQAEAIGIPEGELDEFMLTVCCPLAITDRAYASPAQVKAVIVKHFDSDLALDALLSLQDFVRGFGLTFISLPKLDTDLEFNDGRYYSVERDFDPFTYAFNRDIRMLIADEEKEINAGNYDGILEDLRDIAGIPDLAYQVVDDKVFVLSKLAELVGKNPKRDEQPLDELAISLIADATVSAQEAVSEWGVVPDPYEVVGSLASGFTIRHRAFNSCLPGVFKSEDEVKKVFAHLLVGGIHPGSGDFRYREQPMTLCAPLDNVSIPQRPALWGSSAGDDCLGYPLLRRVEYEPGFEPLSESLFTDLKLREAAWKADDSRAARTAREHSVALWARASSFRLHLLDDPATKISQDEEGDLAELRQLYPELPMLSDASLYHLFDDYQSEVSYLSGWTASRDDDFLFYLLGKASVFPAVPQTATHTGLWSAYALVNGESLDSAFAYAQTATLYDSAITTAALQVAAAIRFLIEDINQTEQRGRSITTLADAFRTGRNLGRWTDS